MAAEQKDSLLTTGDIAMLTELVKPQTDKEKQKQIVSALHEAWQLRCYNNQVKFTQIANEQELSWKKFVYAAFPKLEEAQRQVNELRCVESKSIKRLCEADQLNIDVTKLSAYDQQVDKKHKKLFAPIAEYSEKYKETQDKWYASGECIEYDRLI